MDCHGLSFKEAAQQLFRKEIINLDHNKELFLTFCALSKELDLILHNDYIDRMNYIEQKHREEKNAAEGDKEDIQSKAGPPPPPGKGKRTRAATEAWAKKKNVVVSIVID